MGKLKWIFPLVLALALLAGCAPQPEKSASVETPPDLGGFLEEEIRFFPGRDGAHVSEQLMEDVSQWIFSIE